MKEYDEVILKRWPSIADVFENRTNVEVDLSQLSQMQKHKLIITDLVSRSLFIFSHSN